MAKTGPKPLSAEAFATRLATRLNYKLVKVLAERRFKVECLACNVKRIVEHKDGNTGPKCVCTHKRAFYRVKRTPETHTTEIKDRGYTNYTCVSVGANSKQKNVYLHLCGNEFEMTKDCFVGSGEPCALCRKPLHLDPAEYERRLRILTKNMLAVGTYRLAQKPLLHEYVKCGHRLKLVPETVLRTLTIGKCPVCYPNRLWHRFNAGGRKFRTRSIVEKRFVELLVKNGKVNVDDIEYEPIDAKIKYFNPMENRVCSYAPDFRVGNIHVEVKDLASLGLKEYHWQSKEEALIVNRAKYEAATQQFEDYRIYVHVKGTFHRVREFWTPTERTRLLKL